MEVSDAKRVDFEFTAECLADYAYEAKAKNDSSMSI